MPQSVQSSMLVGTSTKSWEEAAKAAVERAAETLRDLRVAEVVAQTSSSPTARSRPTGPRSKYRSNTKVITSGASGARGRAQLVEQA